MQYSMTTTSFRRSSPRNGSCLYSLGFGGNCKRVYRQGIKNRKVSVNPARQVERRRENNTRDRYLLSSEEEVLRRTLAELAPERLPEIDIALHTSMRRGEQVGCE